MSFGHVGTCIDLNGKSPDVRARSESQSLIAFACGGQGFDPYSGTKRTVNEGNGTEDEQERFVVKLL